MLPRVTLAGCRQAFDKWIEHKGGRMGASLAFFSLLSLAPLLIFVVGIIAYVFGRHEAQDWILHQISSLVGQQGSTMAREMLRRHAHHASSGFVAGLVGLLTLLFGASGVFTELRDGLNTIWQPPPAEGFGWKGFLKTRLFSFGMVLAIGFLLLVSLTLSTAIAAAIEYFRELIPVPAPLLVVVNFIFSIYLIACLFALIFRYVPEVSIDWRDAWSGAVFTSLLFTLGKVLLGLYLGMAGVGSAYGAAGSLVAVVVWVYYSAQIFYYGAEVTWIHSAAGTASPAAANGNPGPPGQLARTARAR